MFIDLGTAMGVYFHVLGTAMGVYRSRNCNGPIYSCTRNCNGATCLFFAVHLPASPERANFRILSFSRCGSSGFAGARQFQDSDFLRPSKYHSSGRPEADREWGSGGRSPPARCRDSPCGLITQVRKTTELSVPRPGEINKIK